jgi:hypothetical protein
MREIVRCVKNAELLLKRKFQPQRFMDLIPLEDLARNGISVACDKDIVNRMIIVFSTNEEAPLGAFLLFNQKVFLYLLNNNLRYEDSTNSEHTEEYRAKAQCWNCKGDGNS